jgi:hypothetical protein
MIPTVEVVVQGLMVQGYKDFGGSNVFRILVNDKTGRRIKVFYDNYENPNHIIIRESVEGYSE